MFATHGRGWVMSEQQGVAGGSSEKAAVSLPIVLLALVGFGVSLYALLLHIQSKNTDGAALGCDVNDLVNCSNVLAGEYGELLGVPLGGYGMAFFAVLAVTGFLPALTKGANKQWFARLRLQISAVGAITSVALAALSYFVIESVCYVCSAVHVICLVAFAFALVSWLKGRSQQPSSDGTALMKFVSTALALSAPALLAGLLAPLIAPQIMGGEADGASSASLDPTATPIPESLLSVSRSRFVGKGEDFRRGSDDAKVVIQMFSDFQCPHCQTTAAAIEKAQQNVGEDKVLFVYRNYPLSNVCNPSIGSAAHAQACQLAEAARCAGQQGKFWEMKKWAFGLIGASGEQLQQLASEEALVARSEQMGAKGDTFRACLTSDVEMVKIRDDIRIADALGISGTPLLVVNNRVYTGNRSPEGLSELFRSLASLAE